MTKQTYCPHCEEVVDTVVGKKRWFCSVCKEDITDHVLLMHRNSDLMDIFDIY
jgi:ribosomal protein L37AE/L43A